jgi:phosphohistidine phosphatase
MLTLILLRHAKSSWADPQLHDSARPLALRGIRACPLVAAWLGAHVLPPTHVLCSTAARTTATWELVADAWGHRPPCEQRAALYMAGPDTLLPIIRAIPDADTRVMIIGHNPGLHELALLLTGHATNPADRAALTAKFPTAGVAVLTFAGPTWAAVKPGAGHLTHVVSPKSLAG